MPVLVKYLLADGGIVGTWDCPVLEVLEAQIVADDPEYGYSLETSVEQPEQLQAGFFYQDGALTPKTVLTLTATPEPFPADGVTQCHVSVSPFVPCTLVVDGTSYALVPADTDLELTSNVPRTFQVTLAPMAAYQCAARTLTATSMTLR